VTHSRGRVPALVFAHIVLWCSSACPGGEGHGLTNALEPAGHLQALAPWFAQLLELPLWGYSSVGRALRSHRRGWGFESPYLHFAPVAQVDRAAVS
jgi:hypothetical protein